MLNNDYYVNKNATFCIRMTFFNSFLGTSINKNALQYNGLYRRKTQKKREEK